MAGIVQGGVEGELFNVVEESVFKVGLRGVIVALAKLKQVLEHARCSTAGRNEFRDVVPLGYIVAPSFDKALAGDVVQCQDAVPDGCCSFQPQVGKPFAELL